MHPFNRTELVWNWLGPAGKKLNKHTKQPMYLQVSVVTCLLFFVMTVCPFAGWAETAGPSTEQEAVEALGSSVFNFDVVAPGIYRSGLIFEDAIPSLKTLGIRTVVNMHHDKKYAERERAFLNAHDIDYQWIPWRGTDYPQDKIVEHVHSLMNHPQARPILIHCQRGAERTGTVIAAWRIGSENWTAQDAYEEMAAHKFRAWRYGHLKKYVYAFAKKRGVSNAEYGNIFERSWTNALYSIYQLRKLNPLNWM
jgi:protein tyrosine phosphatase (PTP) superfamily phosphohydrolase (DUF442 family)